MRITVLNLPHHAEGGFDARPLDEFCQKHDVRSWVEHFYLSAGRPMLAVVVEYEASRSPLGPPPGRPTERYRDPWRDLDPTARPVYARLREWRSLRARQDGVPVYVVFSNRQLAAIATALPTTKEALRSIDGIGKAKADRYADEVFTILASVAPVEQEPVPDGEHADATP